MHQETTVSSMENISTTNRSFSQSSKLQFSSKQTEHVIQEEQQTRKSSYHETTSATRSKSVDHLRTTQASFEPALKRRSTSVFLDEQQGLTTLNHRFADYLHQIKTLADRNIYLRHQIDDIHQQFLNQNSLATEFHHMHRELNKELRLFVSFQIRFQRADYDKKSYKNKLRIFSLADQSETYRQQLKGNLDELNLLKEQYDKQEQDLQMYKQKYHEYTKKLVDYANEYQTRIFERMQSEYSLSTIQEQLLFEREYIQRCQDEWKYLDQIQVDLDTQFNQTELKNVVERIREDYRKYHTDQLTEFESVYQVKLQSMEKDFHQDRKEHQSSDELDQLIEQNRSLQLKTEQLENDLHHLIEQNQKRVNQGSYEYDQLELQLPQLESLLLESRDSTVHLSSEINTYRCLLINLVPSSAEKVSCSSSNKEHENDCTIHYGNGTIWVRI